MFSDDDDDDDGGGDDDDAGDSGGFKGEGEGRRPLLAQIFSPKSCLFPCKRPVYRCVHLR